MAVMSATLDYPQKHPISAEEYLRMGEAGVFAPEARLELIEGEIVEMGPIGSPHAGCVNKLTEMFVLRAGTLALLRPRAHYYSRSHPGVADGLPSSKSQMPRSPSPCGPRCRCTPALRSPRCGSSMSTSVPST
jgi:hypothetical protein